MGNSKTKFVPSNIKELSSRLLNILLKWYLFGDGYKSFYKGEIGGEYFFTVSKKLADDLSEISLKGGRFCSYRNNYRGYYGCIARQGIAHFGRHKSIINYNGKIYCLKLDKNNIFLVRRDNKIAFCGNSLKLEFLENCYEIGKPFALLRPLTALEGKKRGELYKKYGIQLIIPNKRINFITPSGKGSGSWFATSWFCWKLNLPKDLNFVTIS